MLNFSDYMLLVSAAGGLLVQLLDVVAGTAGTWTYVFRAVWVVLAIAILVSARRRGRSQ